MAESERFKDDWNANADFLKYCTDRIILIGAYRSANNAIGWYNTIDELFTLVYHLIDKALAAKLLNDLAHIKAGLEAEGIDLRSVEGQRIVAKRREASQEELNIFQRDLIGGMHKARLIMPKSDRRLGMKELAKEYDLGELGQP
jgi:hypothetical protein